MQLQTMVIVDDSEGCKALECEHGDVEALLASMGKSINDTDVHIFAVPRCVSPLDVDSIIKRQKETEKIEALKRKDRANEEDYRAQMPILSGVPIYPSQNSCSSTPPTHGTPHLNGARFHRTLQGSTRTSRR